jgi:hypothetical protein
VSGILDHMVGSLCEGLQLVVPPDVGHLHAEVCFITLLQVTIPLDYTTVVAPLIPCLGLVSVLAFSET